METTNKIVKCIKCQKDISAEQGVESSKGILCQECASTIKKKRYVIAGAASAATVAAAIGFFTLSPNYNGFGGVGSINDSTSISVNGVDSLNYIEGVIAARDTISGSQPIDNIESFTTQFANNLTSSRNNKASSVIIPSISTLFEINTNYFSKGGDELVKEFAKIYLKTNKQATILVEGYTCDLGGDELNTTLSELRANAVKDVLISAGVSADNIETKWYGKSRFKDFTYADKSDYRRVIVSIK